MIQQKKGSDLLWRDTARLRKRLRKRAKVINSFLPSPASARVPNWQPNQKTRGQESSLIQSMYISFPRPVVGWCREENGRYQAHSFL